MGNGGEGVKVAITAACLQDALRDVCAPSPADLRWKDIAAELGPGNSRRIGITMRMTRNGVPAAAVMRQGRWKNIQTVARYTQNESIGMAPRHILLRPEAARAMPTL